MPGTVAKQFLFITPLTPAIHRDTVREALFQNYLFALKQQQYANWTALIIGEEEKTDDHFIYIKTSSVTKEDKLLDAYKYIVNMPQKPDYLIRLDDDDIISPVALARASAKQFDCYADKYHHFFDLLSGKTSRQKRAWIPNTAIHKLEHALTPFGDLKKPLFANDHSKAWHVYYEDKNVKWAPWWHPVYLRIISPTSITAKASTEKEKDAAYKTYLNGFGKWRKRIPKDFRQLNIEKLVGIIKG